MAKAGGDFTEILVRKKILDRQQLVEATAVANQTGARVQDALVKLGYCTAQEVKNAIAEHEGLPFIDLTEVTIPQAIIELVPESVARENYVLPMAQDNGALKMIMSDPFDVETVQKLQFILNRDIQPVLAIREQIIEAIDRHYGPTEPESVDAMLAEFTDTAIEFTDTEATQLGTAADDSDPRVVKLVDLIITEAITLRASDIHIEPFSDRVRVRYRIDGVLVERDSPPRRLLDPLLSRIKFMSNINTPKRPQPQAGRITRLLAPLLSRTKIKSTIDISERPQPHDGRIKLRVQGEYPFHLRVSILPTQYGESAVLRILDHSKVYIGIRELGLGDEDNQRLRQTIKRPSGIFLVTGPPGSGKTTTLYAVLNELNRPDRRIVTAEDPVEYYLPGIAQWQIHHDLTFANALLSILRQSPDIIVVGGIRDHETAQIAVQAALSGRIVFSTLETTSDAPSAITQLADFGVPPFLIASTVTAIMAQRLVRVVCPTCKEPDEPPMAEIRAADITPDRIATATFMRGRGCNDCHHTGYRGRLGLFEMFKVDAAFREMIFNREPTQALRRQARQLGMRTLLEDGINKALMGITTLEEVCSACHHELETRPRDVLTVQPH